MAFFCLEVSTDSTSFLINPQYTQDHVEAKVVVAGLSTTCSQKIHNQLVCMIFEADLISCTSAFFLSPNIFISPL